jgi:magnesium chelatase subunit I
MHFGLLPRANRGIFAINELPDLSAKIQVGLFNIMQEGDVQLKGYPVRLPLDVVLCFTANPEDYTARGKIITPLKDRIGSEILTHYPRSVELGMAITTQEAWIDRGRPVVVPGFVVEVIERVAFEARGDRRVDKRSGVSQRLPISVLEHALSNAEQRAIREGESEVVPRLTDVYAATASMTGKLELEYEGELVGSDVIARELIRRAAGVTFTERAGELDVERVVAWFDGGGVLRLSGEEPASAGLKAFAAVDGLRDLVLGMDLPDTSKPGVEFAACELALEGLAALKRISRNEDDGSWGRARPERRRPRALDD